MYINKDRVFNLTHDRRVAFSLDKKWMFSKYVHKSVNER